LLAGDLAVAAGVDDGNRYQRSQKQEAQHRDHDPFGFERHVSASHTVSARKTITAATPKIIEISLACRRFRMAPSIKGQANKMATTSETPTMPPLSDVSLSQRKVK